MRRGSGVQLFKLQPPQLYSLDDYKPALVTEVYSREESWIGEFFTERRYFVKLSGVSPVLIKALIAAEDAQFFVHTGLNYWSILRAALKNLLSMEIKQGGSTITQQIQITSSYPEKSFTRKLREAILARRIETFLSKTDILPST